MSLNEIYTRSSVRSYKAGAAVTEEEIAAMLRAGMSAPSAGNFQPWEFVVADDRAQIDALADVLEYGKMLKKAPLAIVVCGNMDRTFPADEGRDYWIQDVSAATENILLAAHMQGLGAVWLGVYPLQDRIDNISRILGLPENVLPFCVVSVGRRCADPVISDKWDEGKIHRNRW